MTLNRTRHTRGAYLSLMYVRTFSGYSAMHSVLCGKLYILSVVVLGSIHSATFITSILGIAVDNANANIIKFLILNVAGAVVTVNHVAHAAHAGYNKVLSVLLEHKGDMSLDFIRTDLERCGLGRSKAARLLENSGARLRIRLNEYRIPRRGSL